MPSACGVTWDGTSGGKLDRSAIPDPPDHKSHFLNAAETKGDSSFPVVDGDGNLRAGNVSSAWDLRNNGEGVSEECLRKLDNAFDEDVLPESAYDNSRNRINVTELDGIDTDEPFGINVNFAESRIEGIGDGFNKYGVRENEDGSVDVRFNAMEPGVRKGYEITKDFLRRVTNKDYERIPVQLDHSESVRANVGYVENDNIKFSDPFARTQIHIPNTGSSVREDTIADFTHEPPAIQDVSFSFDPKTVEVEAAPESSEADVRLTDGRIDEVSLALFPAGYDNGGLTPAFSKAADKAVEMAGCDGDCDCDCGGDCGDSEPVYSQLVVKQFDIK